MAETALTKAPGSRIYKFDNVKFLLILTVVVGHVLEGFLGKSDLAKSLFIFFYGFHMPLFVFLSGLFQKKFTEEHPLRPQKIAFFILTGFLLKALVAVTRVIAGKKPSVHVFGGSDVTWFLFVLAMCMTAAYLLRKVHPAIVLPITFAIGCVCGYFDFIGDTLYLSRFFVFLPVYLTGYYLTPEQVQKFTSRWAVKLPCLLCSLAFLFLSFWKVDQVYQLRRLFTGKNPFSTLPFDCGFQHRLLCYAISALLCVALIAFVPNKKIPLISDWGGSTLAVYFWHKPILYLVDATGIIPLMMRALGHPYYLVVLVLWGVLLTVLLSLKPCSAPLTWLQKGVNKVPMKFQWLLITGPFLLGTVILLCVKFLSV